MKIQKFDFAHNTNVVSERLYNEHLKLYEGYISKINEIDETLAENPEIAGSNSTYSHYRGLKKGETFALNGVILHEEYFRNMGGGRKEIGAATTRLLNHFFGATDVWVRDFAACAASARGWCCMIYDQRGRVLRNILQDSHDDGVINMSFPIIVLDMYEHAYFMDYGTDKAAYIKNFMENIDWDIVEGRAEKVVAQLPELQNSPR
ncbi:MAG: Fe-Mn family superoxide dismutase [Defluviitaleaceae bacterium]|nr:Fe-Mn family superoxide dismutase [Defluviitaleaceae bacterium]